MSDHSAIEWTDATWNPIRALDLNTGKIGWHCEHATTGCEFCYAERMNKRLGTGLPFKPGHREHIKIFLDEKMLLVPLKWKRPRKIFVGSMTDLFADFVTDEMLDRIFAVMALCPQHTFQVLTKRAARMRAYIGEAFTGKRYLIATANELRGSIIGGVVARQSLIDDHPIPSIRPLHNVWLGVSCERQQEADERIPLLLQAPAAVRFVSAEPLLGPIDLTAIKRTQAESFMRPLDGRFNKLDWIIVGGESGPDARPMHPDWARSLRDQCAAVGVAFFFKQWGEFHPIQKIPLGEIPNGSYGVRFPDATVWRVGKKAAGRLLDGRTHDEFPAVYNAQDDFAKSRDVGSAASGPEWEPK